MIKKNILITMLLTFLSLSAFADAPAFNDLDKNDLETIIKDFSSNFTFTSVSPASSLGKTFGIEFGVVGGTTEVPGIEKIVSDVDPDVKVEAMPHLGILAAVSVPMGFTGEINFIPTIDQADIKLGVTGLSLKWTMTDIIELPVDIALKLHRTQAAMSFKQVIDDPTPIDTSFDYETTVMGLTGVVSKSFPVVEPYAGFGFIQADGSLKADGASVFAPSYTTSNKANVKQSGTHYFAGLQLNLLFFRLGFEAGKVFDSTKMTAKLSFKF